MNKLSIKLAILIPSLIVLIVGIVIMIAVVGTLSSDSTISLTEDLMQASVAEFTNEFRAFTDQVYGALSSTTAIIENFIEPEFVENVADPRGDVVHFLSDVLLSNDKLVGAWTVWEPNAFDGRDADFANAPFHDSTGRFVPYVFRDGNSYGVEALVGYDVPGDGDFYLGARNSGRSHVTDPYAYEVGGRTINIFSLAIPVIVDGRVQGVVGLDIDLNDITQVINAGSILEDGYLFTISPGGIITTHRSAELMMSSFDDTWMGNYSSQVETLLSEGGTFSIEAFSDVTNSNVSFLGRGVSIGNTGRYWLIGGVVPMETVNATANELLNAIILIGIALILVVAATIFLIVRHSLRKLPILTATANDIALGSVVSDKLDHSTGKTGNEIILLERAFVQMTDAIRGQAELMTEIADGDYSRTVEARSDFDVMSKALSKMLENTNNMLKQINVSATEVSTVSRQVANGAQSLAQGSTEQAASIEDLSRSVTEIAEMTIENAAIADRTSKLSEEIKINAEKGSRQMDEMITAVSQINDASRNISKIIKTIDDIAFQTNILALNAAVEAARAGQHGKGFAVVAEEVRNLASKSAAAAKDTGNMIQNSMDKAELGSRIASETATSLSEIVKGINESTEMIHEIASASDVQTKGITALNNGIDQVGQVIAQNSATAEESAASSQQMSGQADMLSRLISQFKLREEDEKGRLTEGKYTGVHDSGKENFGKLNESDGGSNSQGFGKY